MNNRYFLISYSHDRGFGSANSITVDAAFFNEKKFKQDILKALELTSKIIVLNIFEFKNSTDFIGAFRR